MIIAVNHFPLIDMAALSVPPRRESPLYFFRVYPLKTV